MGFFQSIARPFRRLVNLCRNAARRIIASAAAAPDKPAKSAKAGKAVSGKPKAGGTKSGQKRSGRKAALKVVGLSGNTISKSGDLRQIKSSVKFVKGSGNLVEIGPSVLLKNATVAFRGLRNRLIIEEGCEFTGRILIKGNDQTVHIGRGTTTVDVYILCSEGCDVIIGAHCMFSRKIEIRTSDAHSVVDRQSGNRINRPGSIRIGDHVWVGVGCIINKGTVIADDCIIGAQSFVNRAFDQKGSIIAGAPARLVKSGITWNRRRKKHFGPAELDFWIPSSDIKPRESADEPVLASDGNLKVPAAAG